MGAWKFPSLTRRFARTGFGLCALLVVTGCSGDNKLLATSAIDGKPAGAPSSAYGLSNSKQAEPEPFNPFNDSPPSSYGRREVLTNPSIGEVMKVGALPEMSLGRANAPVTVIKYASLTCPHCRRFQANVFPVFKREYIDTGKVRFIIREFPIGRSSGNATIALRCAPQSKYFDLYARFLSQQGRWVSQNVRLDNIFKVASQVGLSRAKFDACLKNQDLIQGLNWVKDRGRTLGIIGTPNFFIQNKLVKKVLGIDDLRALVDAELGVKQNIAVAN
ncbi:MAG: DsbA family protein [Alphaproteobacteria bacterium]|nr:DsbA family protein [Alphaproteobacteria bacterium]